MADEQTKTLAQLHKKGDKNALVYVQTRAEGVEFADGSVLSDKVSTLENKIEVIKKGNDALVIQDGKTVVIPDFYTKTEADAKFLTEHQDISGKADADTVYTKTAADEKFAEKATTLSGYGITNAYTKAETDSAISTAVADASHLKRVIVTTLPAVEDADENTIYMILKTSGKNGNKYDEYLLTNGELEKIGDTEVDLTDYAKTANVYTKTQADEKFAEKATTLSGYGITNAYTKTEADAKFLTEHQDISGKADADKVYTKTAADEKFAEKATTLSGYGITNAYTKAEIDGLNLLEYEVIKTL